MTYAIDQPLRWLVGTSYLHREAPNTLLVGGAALDASGNVLAGSDPFVNSTYLRHDNFVGVYGQVNYDITHALEQFTSITSTPPYRHTSNIPNTRINGAEAELTARLFTHLTFGAGIGYTDATVNDDTSGLYTPRFTPNLSAEHTFPLVADWRLVSRVDFRYQDAQYLGRENHALRSLCLHSQQAFPCRRRGGYCALTRMSLASFGPLNGIPTMSSQSISDRVVNLSDYRAERAAHKSRSAAPAPYLLWYPGLGYVQVGQAATVFHPFGTSVTLNPQRY